MLSAVQSVYTDCLLAMKVNCFHGSTQSPSVGLQQGCPLSTTLFGLFFDGLHNHIQSSLPDAGIKVQHLRITDMEYADDVFLSAESPARLQALIDTMTRYCEDLADQCGKAWVLGGERSHTFTCMNQSLEQVSDFKYLGLHFHESGRIDHIIAPILDKATAAWAVVQNKHAYR